MLTALDLDNEIKKYIDNVYEGDFFINCNPREKSQRVKDSVNNFIKQIVDYQKENKISAVYFLDLDWEGHKINCPFYSFYLGWSLNDLKIFKNSKDRLLNWFLNFATEKIEKEGYTLCQEVFDEEGRDLSLPLSVEQLKETAKEFDWVELINYKNNVAPNYSENGKDVEYWEKYFTIYLRRGYNLNWFMGDFDDDGTESFYLKKSFLIDPRE